MTNTAKQTSVNDNQIGTDPTLSRLVRLRHWFRDNTWLVIGCAVVLVIVPSGAQDTESPDHRKRRQTPAEPKLTERERLTANQAWNLLSPRKQAAMRELHAAVLDDSELGETLADYHAWLAAIPGDPDIIRDKILNEQDPWKRVEIVRQHLEKQNPSEQPPAEVTELMSSDTSSSSVDSANRPHLFPSTMMQGPVLVGREFELAIEIIAEWCDTSRTSDQGSMIEEFQFYLQVINNFDLKLCLIHDGSSRPAAVQMQKQMQKQIQDIIELVPVEERRQLIARRIHRNPAGLMLLMIRSVVRKLDSVSVTDMERRLLDLPTVRQRIRKSNRPQDFKKRLVYLWMDEKHPELRDLMRRYFQLARDSVTGPNQQKRHPDQKPPGLIPRQR